VSPGSKKWAGGIWTATGNLHVSRINFTATLLQNGKVLVAGGHHAHIETTSAELYDPNTGTWAVTGSMASGRNSHTATLLQNGNVLVASGYGGGASCELYDPSTGTWSATGSLSVEREGMTATLLLNGKVLIAGGYSGGPQSEPCQRRTLRSGQRDLDDHRQHGKRPFFAHRDVATRREGARRRR